MSQQSLHPLTIHLAPLQETPCGPCTLVRCTNAVDVVKYLPTCLVTPMILSHHRIKISIPPNSRGIHSRMFFHVIVATCFWWLKKWRLDRVIVWSALRVNIFHFVDKCKFCKCKRCCMFCTEKVEIKYGHDGTVKNVTAQMPHHMKTNTLCCAGLLPSCLVAALFRPSCASRCLFHVFHLSNCIGCAVRMSRTSQRLRPESSFGVDLVPQLPEPKISNIAFSSKQKVDSTQPPFSPTRNFECVTEAKNL